MTEDDWEKQDLLLYGISFKLDGVRISPDRVEVRLEGPSPIETIKDFTVLMEEFTRLTATRGGNVKLVADFRAKHFPG